VDILKNNTNPKKERNMKNHWRTYKNRNLANTVISEKTENYETDDK
jgi:hypothetical protein